VATNIAVAKQMVEYLKKHGLTVPRLSTTNPVWGRGKKQAAWRVSGHAFGAKRAATGKTQALCDLLFPLTPAEKLRHGVLAGYHSIMGAKEGGSVQRAIAKWCGLSHNEPWCAETWWWVHVVKAGFKGPHPSNPYYVPTVELWAQAHRLIVRFRDALPGMSVTLVWDGKRGVGRGDHIGVLVKTGILRHIVSYNPRVAAGNANGSPDAVKTETFYWWQVNVIFDPAKLQK